jgi:hypothetical protein
MRARTHQERIAMTPSSWARVAFGIAVGMGLAVLAPREAFAQG